MIKGRYFFWIPFFCYLVYLVYPTLIIHKKLILEIVFIATIMQLVLSIILYGVYLACDDYNQTKVKRDLIIYPYRFLLIHYAYINYGINNIFDKYFTINK